MEYSVNATVVGSKHGKGKDEEHEEAAEEETGEEADSPKAAEE